MLMKEMKAGKPLELYIIRDGYRYRLTSKVEDTAPGKVFIPLIISRGKIFRFLDTDKLELIYKDNDKMWRWTDIKASLSTLENVKVHRLESTKEGEPYNRRSAFRVRLGQEHFATKLVPKNEVSGDFVEEDFEAGLWSGDYEYVRIPCVIKDLSENGIGIYANDKLSIGALLEVRINTQEGEMKMLGKVVRADSGDFGKYKEFYGCTLLRTDRNLGKFLTIAQRQQLKKSWGKRR